MIRYRTNVTMPRPGVAMPSSIGVSNKGGREPQAGNYVAPVLLEIERHLRLTGMSDRRLGKEAVGDSALVHDLRRGRDPSSRTVARIRAYIGQGVRHGE